MAPIVALGLVGGNRLSKCRALAAVGAVALEGLGVIVLRVEGAISHTKVKALKHIVSGPMLVAGAGFEPATFGL